MRRSPDLPPLQALRAFEAAGRLLSFRRAAEELLVTQSAVSHQIALLEGALGVRLFVRKARGVSLTEAAARYLAAVQASFGGLEQATAILRGSRERSALRVSLTPSFAANFLAPRLGRFAQAHPDVDLLLDPTLQMADIAASAADLAIRYGGGDYP
ncbi:MAG: LysR family transcriptional regulator, partial [Elsteraceae bacterium]